MKNITQALEETKILGTRPPFYYVERAIKRHAAMIADALPSQDREVLENSERKLEEATRVYREAQIEAKQLASQVFYKI